MEKELKYIRKTIEVYQGGQWRKWEVNIPRELNERLLREGTILIPDEDSEEIFIRDCPQNINSNLDF
jgi:hypothetical protein